MKIRHTKTLIILTFLLFISTGSLYCQSGSSNPFFKGTENSSVSEKIPVKNNGFIVKITGIQKQLNQKMSSVVTDYRENKNADLLLIIAFFAFIYGFIHAMTPGHGKNVILAWILTSERTYIKVLITSITGMLFHVFNSVIMVYLIWYLIKGKISVQSPVFIKYFSFAACIILFVMSLKSLYDLFHNSHEISSSEDTNAHSKEHSHKSLKKHSHRHNLEIIKSTTTLKECTMIALGIGIVPCPVAAILTVFMISGKMFGESLLTAFFFFIGMTLTLVLYTSFIWLMRSFITGMKNRHLVKIRDYGLPAAGSILLMFSGFIIISPYLSL